MAISILKSAREIQNSPVLLLDQKQDSISLPSAFIKRDEILERASNVEVVAGEASQKIAVQSLVEINDMLTSAESDREVVKKPFWEMGKKIDAFKNAFVAKLEVEKTRIKKLLVDYQLKVEAKAREDSAKQQAALDRTADEQNKLEEEDDKRQADLRKSLEAAANANTDAERKKATEEQKRLQDAVDEAALRNAQLDIQAGQNLVVAKVAKPTGMSVKKTWKFEVVSLHHLYLARPELVSLEAKTREINKVINDSDGKVNLPGLRIFEQTDVSAK